mgnify:FL=1
MAKRKRKTPSQPPSNGIRELVWVDPTSLDENPLNWRKHPQRQTDAIGASIKANGWADTLLFNENTGRLIDGHARRQVAIEEGLDSVPVLVGNWSEEQEKHLLATLDPLGAMAETDAGALSTLTDMVKNEQANLDELTRRDQEILEAVTEDLNTYAFNVSIGEDRSTFLPEQEAIQETSDVDDNTSDVYKMYIDDEVIFESSNDWGIPDLLPNMLADVPPDLTWDRSDTTITPSSWYCHSARPFPEKREGGVLGFFTEDYRFENSWTSKVAFAQKLMDEDWVAVCLPDFSIYAEEPFAVQLYNLYRSRWLGRFWQELGIHVIPLIQAGGDQLANELYLETIPKEAPLVAMQFRTVNRRTKGKKEWARVQELIEDTIEVIKPQSFILYGGIELRKRLGKLPTGTNYIFLDSYMTKRRHKMKESN